MYDMQLGIEPETSESRGIFAIELLKNSPLLTVNFEIVNNSSSVIFTSIDIDSLAITNILLHSQ